VTARYLIDTNIASAAINDGSGPVARYIRNLAADALVTSVIVAGELRFGAAKKGSSALATRIENLLSYLPVLPIDIAVTSHYAAIRKSLELKGTPIGQNDLWIAAHARAADLVLVTDNVGEFGRVDGLQIENWLRGGA
jgi:tRNA(fMet)-specific endonuclease VapC